MTSLDQDVASAPLPVVVARRRWPSASILVMSLFMIGMGASIVADEGLRPSSLQVDVGSELGRVVGVGAVLVGAAGLMLTARQLVRRGPALVIDDQGLTIDTDMLGPPLRLRWEEVSGAVDPAPGGRWRAMVLVQLVDPQAFIEGLSGPSRLLARLRRRNGLSPVLVPGHLLAVSAAAVAGRIQAEATRRRP